MKKILVFRIGHLGDTLVALPAFWALRNAFPDANLSLLSNVDRRNPSYLTARSILPANGLFDSFIDYPTNTGRLNAVPALLGLFARLRAAKFDAVYYLMPRMRTIEQIDRDEKFFRRTGIENLFGFDFLRMHSLAGKIPSPAPEVISEANVLLALLEDAGVTENAGAGNSGLCFTGKEISDASEWIAAHLPAANKQLLAVAPGSKWESKIWFEDRFISVVADLIKSRGVFPIVFGGSEDREKGDRLIAAWGLGANAAGVLNVRDAGAVLSRCSLYLGNDTGTMHLAAAAGVRCVGIFAAIDYPGRFLPFGDDNIVFRKRVECEGCHTPDCFNDHKCLSLVETDEVLAACEKLLAG